MRVPAVRLPEPVAGVGEFAPAGGSEPVATPGEFAAPLVPADRLAIDPGAARDLALRGAALEQRLDRDHANVASRRSLLPPHDGEGQE